MFPRCSHCNGTQTTWSYTANTRNWSLSQNLSGTTSDVTYGFTLNPAGQAYQRTISNSGYSYVPSATSAQSYTPNGLNQYTAVGGATYVSDARANLTSDGARTYAYDLDNHLTSVSGAQALTLAYDPLGRLRQVTTGGTTTTWLWDGDRLVAEYDNAGALSARYAHGPGPDEPLVDWFKTTSAGRLWFHTDHQNTVIALTDGTGAINGSPLTYDAYGQPAGGAYTGPRFRYTGQTSLPGAPPLWHYKARAYAPGIGRFLQTDPIGYEDSLNLYGYVGNDPFNRTDPTGMIACCTLQFGGTVELSIGPLRLRLSGGVAVDTQLNVATYGSASAGAGLERGATVSRGRATATGDAVVTNANRVSDLQGTSRTTTVGAGAELAASGSFTSGNRPKEEGGEYSGFGVSLGLGAAAPSVTTTQDETVIFEGDNQPAHDILAGATEAQRQATARAVQSTTAPYRRAR